jgi:hypothetical protein
MNESNLPQGITYEETTSDLHPLNKIKSFCRAIDSSEGAESEEELLPKDCIHTEDHWLCHEINKCLNCKTNGN